MSTKVDLAIEAFRDVEKAEFLLERKQRDLFESLVGLSRPEMAEYLVATTEIINEFEEKREKARVA